MTAGAGSGTFEQREWAQPVQLASHVKDWETDGPPPIQFHSNWGDSETCVYGGPSSCLLRMQLAIFLFCICPASSPLFHISENCRLSHLVRARALLLWLPSQGPAYPLRCTSAGYDGDAGRKPARLAQKQKTLEELAEYVNVDEPVPQVTLEQVNASFARSGGPGGQNVNKVNTKVDMRFKVMEASWLPERIRLKLLQTEKNRINSEGELVVSSTRTRTQKGNIEDALCKIQELITAAAYIPPPPSDEKIKRINKLAKIENERRLQDKKRAGSKKSDAVTKAAGIESL